MSHPTARPPLSLEPTTTWLIGPDQLAAIRADDDLLTRLARGERPNTHDIDPAARVLALWLREVDQAGGAR